MWQLVEDLPNGRTFSMVNKSVNFKVREREEGIFLLSLSSDNHRSRSTLSHTLRCFCSWYRYRIMCGRWNDGFTIILDEITSLKTSCLGQGDFMQKVRWSYIWTSSNLFLVECWLCNPYESGLSKTSKDGKREGKLTKQTSFIVVTHYYVRSNFTVT